MSVYNDPHAYSACIHLWVTLTFLRSLFCVIINARLGEMFVNQVKEMLSYIDKLLFFTNVLFPENHLDRLHGRIDILRLIVTGSDLC